MTIVPWVSYNKQQKLLTTLLGFFIDKMCKEILQAFFCNFAYDLT